MHEMRLKIKTLLQARGRRCPILHFRKVPQLLSFWNIFTKRRKRSSSTPCTILMRRMTGGKLHIMTHLFNENRWCYVCCSLCASPDPFWIKADSNLLSLNVMRCTRTRNEAQILRLLACRLGLSCLSSKDMKQHIFREANRSLVGFKTFKWKTEWKTDWNWEAFRPWKYYWTKPKHLWDLLGGFLKFGIVPSTYSTLHSTVLYNESIEQV